MPEDPFMGSFFELLGPDPENDPKVPKEDPAPTKSVEEEEAEKGAPIVDSKPAVAEEEEKGATEEEAEKGAPIVDSKPAVAEEEEKGALIGDTESGEEEKKGPQLITNMTPREFMGKAYDVDTKITYLKGRHRQIDAQVIFTGVDAHIEKGDFTLKMGLVDPVPTPVPTPVSTQVSETASEPAPVPAQVSETAEPAPVPGPVSETAEPTPVPETAQNSDILASLTWIPTRADPTKLAYETTEWVTRFMPGLNGILPKPSSKFWDLKRRFVGLEGVLNFRVPVNTERLVPRLQLSSPELELQYLHKNATFHTKFGLTKNPKVNFEAAVGNYKVATGIEVSSDTDSSGEQILTGLKLGQSFLADKNRGGARVTVTLVDTNEDPNTAVSLYQTVWPESKTTFGIEYCASYDDREHKEKISIDLGAEHKLTESTMFKVSLRDSGLTRATVRWECLEDLVISFLAKFNLFTPEKSIQMGLGLTFEKTKEKRERKKEER